MKPQPLDLVWLLLLASTGLTWWLGASGALRTPSLALMACMLGLAWLKGAGVALEFMALRHGAAPVAPCAAGRPDTSQPCPARYERVPAVLHMGKHMHP